MNDSSTTSQLHPAQIAPEPETLVNLTRYPIHQDAGKELVAAYRTQFSQHGVCLLPEFLTSAAIERMIGEVNAVLSKTFYCHNVHNAYLLKEDDPRHPERHARNRRLRTDVGAVAFDYLPQDGALVALYRWDALTRLIGGILGFDTLYRGVDPLGALSVNVFEPGGAHAWHFDESHFTVTIMLQSAGQGGTFQYVPNVRSAEDNHYADVERILDGHDSQVLELPLKPGTLSIFAGRNTLHRVTTVAGERHRLVPVLCYDTRPDSLNSEDVRLLFYGRRGTEQVA